MASIETVPEADPAQGPAAILAIGTANPPNCILQADYPDYFFRVTNCEHMTELKEMFGRICEKSMVRKRHFLLSEEIIKKYPCLRSYGAPSVDARQDITVPEVPKLGKEAALKAIENWGQPISKITHLIFCANPGVDMPGADIQLTQLLGLELSVKRMIFYHPPCYMGAHALGIAKDIAENNAAARVLVVSCDITVGSFRAPGPSEQEADIPSLILQATAGDGAAALIIGADPSRAERPLFQIVSAKQTMIPDSHYAIRGELRERGLTAGLSKDIPSLISQNTGKCLAEAFDPIGLEISDWNSLFWAVQPSGAAVLKQIEANVGLKPEKLAATWHVLSEYGNMGSGTVYFILDEISRRSVEERKGTTGEGMKWGVVVGIGAGLTISTVVLRTFQVHVFLFVLLLLLSVYILLMLL